MPTPLEFATHNEAVTYNNTHNLLTIPHNCRPGCWILIALLTTGVAAVVSPTEAVLLPDW